MAKGNPDESTHEHCWHDYGGTALLTLPRRHIVEKCCRCHATREHPYGKG